MKSYLVGIFLFVLSMTVGCIPFRAKPLAPAQTAAAFEARTLANPGLKVFLEKNLHHEISPWPPKVWTFQLLTLVAFYYHPDLDVARAKWGVAKAGILTAGQRPNPTLNIPSELVTNPDIGTSPWVAGFNIDIPIETAGKRGYRIQKAKHQSEMAQINIATVAWQVRSRLRKSLLDLYAARQQQIYLQQALTLHRENLSILKEKESKESLSPWAVTSAQLPLDEAILSFRDAQKREAEAWAQTAQALGVPVAALNGLSISLNFFERPPQQFPLPKLRRQALFNRSDILQGLEEYAAAESALRLEIAKQYPDISIGPGYLFDQGENKWTLGLSLTLPILSHNKGPIAETDAMRTEVATRFAALQAQIIGDIDLASSGYRAVLTKLEIADEILEDQKKREEFIKDRTSPGELRRVALLQTRLQIASVAISRFDTLVEVQQSLGSLEDAIQYPLEPDALVFEVPETNPREASETHP
jgi:outer membrane protein, heavy metal efflux system